MVYVQNYSGHPLMPTENHAKVRILLKQNKAVVVKRCPFTIRLAYESTNYTQPVTLGIDAGSRHIGASATTEYKEIYASDVELRNDIVKLLSDRREIRRSRRSRKTRYRKARFNNRKRGDGWLAPSIRQKIQTHLKVVDDICKLVPVTKIIVETASFDIQKIKDPGIKGTGYQQGEQLGFWNIREYVLCRDGHKCQCCKGKSKDKVLNVHHIESRKTGGDAPNNLITLCETCHKGYHKGIVDLPDTIKRGMKFKDAAFMGIMRWAFYGELKNRYPDVSLTYGYLTKNTRIKYGLSKEHYVDARCISGHPLAEPLGEVYYMKKIRRHNRQIHKCNISKGSIRKRNQAEYLVKGFRRFDRVTAKGREWYIHGRRVKGAFVLKSLNGDTLEITPSKIKLVTRQHGFITERKKFGQC